jgi:hypothetical protein
VKVPGEILGGHVFDLDGTVRPEAHIEKERGD